MAPPSPSKRRRLRVSALLATSCVGATAGYASPAYLLAQPNNNRVELAEAAPPQQGDATAATPTGGPPPVSTLPQAPQPASPPAPAAPAAPPKGSGRGVKGLPAPAPQPARLNADHLRYAGNVIIAEGTSDRPVSFESGDTRILATRINLDLSRRHVEAQGNVQLNRATVVSHDVMGPRDMVSHRRTEAVTETLRGGSLSYDAVTQSGQLDNAQLRMPDFNLSTRLLLVNGRRYVAHDVVLRPGGLTPAEEKIYGTPPLNLRAKTVTVEAGSATARAHIQARGAALYFKNTRLLPVPSFILSRTQSLAGQRENSAFQLTPRISFNSADRLLVTTQLRFPLARNIERSSLIADIGLSERVGFRGGLIYQTNSGLGQLQLEGRHADVVTTQLTNRIEVDRLPELQYTSPALPVAHLGGGHIAGVGAQLDTGRFTERTIGDSGQTVRSSRQQGTIYFTTRINPVDGPYATLFARESIYTAFGLHYRNLGYEVGYEGNLGPRIRGLFSYTATSLSGATPFVFDRVLIAREVRSTFDILATPRYIVPIDVRYDLGMRQFRDESFGLLRSYKTFAYGATYDTALKEVRLDFRSGF